MVLALMHAYESGLLKLGQVQDMLSAIENFHFIFTAITSQRSSGGISLMYALHARNLLAATDANSRGRVLAELKKKLKSKLPPFEEFVANFTLLSFTNEFTKQKKLIQYILAKLDRHNTNGIAIDYEQMSIEHIRSQSDTSGNKALIGSVGNLLLCDPKFNSGQLASKAFTEKKKLLMKSRVCLDSPIKAASNGPTMKSCRGNRGWPRQHFKRFGKCEERDEWRVAHQQGAPLMTTKSAGFRSAEGRREAAGAATEVPSSPAPHTSTRAIITPRRHRLARRLRPVRTFPQSPP